MDGALRAGGVMGGVGFAGAILLLTHRVYNDQALTWVVIGGGMACLILALATLWARHARAMWDSRTVMLRAQVDANVAAGRLMALTKGMGGSGNSDPFGALLAGMNVHDVVDEPAPEELPPGHGYGGE